MFIESIVGRCRAPVSRNNRVARRRALVAVVALQGLLAGCTTPPPPSPPLLREVVQLREVRVPEVSPVDLAGRQVLAWSEELRSMPADAVAQEIARLGDGSATPATGMRLALALMHVRNPGDLPRAQHVLEALQAAPAAAGPQMDWRPWARWLVARLQQERRQEEQIERQAQQLREGQRRLEQANQTLEALKAIERRLAPRQGTEGRGR